MTSERFIEILNDVSETENARSYSGRAMYGKRCVGLVIESDDKLVLLGAQLMAGIDDADMPYERDELLHILQTTRTDSMGLNVIAYWPRTEWPDDVYDDADEDEEDEA